MLDTIEGFYSVIFDYDKSKNIHESFVIYENLKFILLVSIGIPVFIFSFIFSIILLLNIFNLLINYILQLFYSFNKSKE